MKLTLQQLCALCNHTWEAQKMMGFHMDPACFKKYVESASYAELRVLLESLGLLFKTIEEIGQTEIELVAPGHPSMWAPLCKTQTAKELDVEEHIWRIGAAVETKE